MASRLGPAYCELCSTSFPRILTYQPDQVATWMKLHRTICAADHTAAALNEGHALINELKEVWAQLPRPAQVAGIRLSRKLAELSASDVWTPEPLVRMEQVL